MIMHLQKATNALFHTLEGWMNRIFGNAVNPLYHLGPLSFFLFWVVLVSGIYIFIFFETNLAGAYLSVEYMTHDPWWLAGIMRSLHRYASDAVMITILLHLAREFSRDRYRGIRWFSWFTGVPTLWLVVILGITGYWLVWDELAQYTALASAELIDWLPLASGSMTSNFLSGGMTDRFFTLISFIHLVGLPVALVFLLWTHVSRISKVAFNPPRPLAIGVLLGLVVLSLIKPAVSHGPATFAGAPTVLHIDWFYLNIYPLADRLGPQWAWGLSTFVTLLFMIMPWLPPRKELPPPQVSLDMCDGCQQCARDCPFGAITMRPRSDGRSHEFQPQVDPSLCTACGICVGGCHYANPFRSKPSPLVVGIDMPHASVEALRQEVVAKVGGLVGMGKVLLIGCQHGAPVDRLAAADTAVVVLPCSGMLPPSFIAFALRQGAHGVLVSGCRANDCYYRLGNSLIHDRIQRVREPHLTRRADLAKVRLFTGSPKEHGDLVATLAAFRSALTHASDEGISHA